MDRLVGTRENPGKIIRGQINMDGILNINKPAGRTSFSVVAEIKRLVKERHAGHAGTLDPDASGVLPICLGKATRIVEFLMETHKVYRAVIEMGTATDSYDGAGKVVRRQDYSCVTRDMLVFALNSFRGAIRQTPPMFSALKHRGQPLYNLAREGISVERPSRPVMIYRLELLDFQLPLVTLEIECSRGTYIRSIANDLGEILGCGAYLKNLVRTGYGPFKLENAITPDTLGEAVKKGDWTKHLLPIDTALTHLPSLVLDAPGEEAIKKGQILTLNPESLPDGGAKYSRAYSVDGRFLAILIKDKDTSLWRPEKVFI